MARRAGVSTKTLYRIVPNKAALFEGVVSDRLDSFLSDFSLHVAEGADIETGLNAALMAYADLALDPDVVALQRIILQEAGSIPRSGGDILQERHCPHRRGAVEVGCAFRSSAGSSTSTMSTRRQASSSGW